MATIRQMNQQDLNLVNSLLSRAFSQGKADDGYMHTHVPLCRTEFLQAYLYQCPEGCFVLEDESRLRGASFCHVNGSTGWVGPIAVAPEKHLMGFGKKLMSCSIDFLKSQNCSTIGLEANPRSRRNLGFYMSLGFLPTILSIDMIRPISFYKHGTEAKPHKIMFFSRMSPNDKQVMLTRIKELTHAAAPGTDYTNLIKALHRARAGETVLFVRKSTAIGFAITQTVSTSVDEKDPILRTVVFIGHPQTPEKYIKYFLADLEEIAWRFKKKRHFLRVPMYSPRFFKHLLNRNYRIINSDQRMVLDGYYEQVDRSVLYLNRWV